MQYTKDQIGTRSIRQLNSRSKNVYALYVDQGDGSHQPVLVGADWQQCRDKTADLVARGVSRYDIYGTTDDRTGANFGQAAIHLWLPGE